MPLSGQILICGVNWIGDTIMSMPAIEGFRRRHPQTRLTLLVKPAVRALWEMSDVPDQLIDLGTGLRGTWDTIQRVKAAGPYTRAYVLPHSFRSALIPWMAGVPERHGLPGPFRDTFLTQIIKPGVGPDRRHQVYEYLDLLVPDASDAWAPPRLQVSDDVRESVTALLSDLERPLVAIIPGAARGPSKQWPLERFVELGRRLAEEDGYGVAVLGTASEKEMCDSAADAIGSRARSLAGHTRFKEWCGVLQLADLVVANDSGGMHVAAALGTPLVALYGVTDPEVTGPLTRTARILQKSDRRSRDVPRDSQEARAALEAITVEEALRAARERLKTEKAYHE